MENGCQQQFAYIYKSCSINFYKGVFNMTNLKRWLAAVLAGLMILPLAACGSNTEMPEDSTVSTTAAVTEGVPDYFPDVEKNDYKGETFHMVGFEAPGSWYYSESMSDEQGSMHVLNNTVYEMNTLVEEYLGVNITYEYISKISTGGEIFDTVWPTIMSGDDAYQLCILHPYYSNVNFITQNGVLDFYTLPDFDPEQPYWNSEVMEQLSINGHAFLGVGDICKYKLNVLYCNKDLLNTVGRTVPYDKVRNGTWTLDEFFTISSDLYVDNGDGQRNNEDTYGFASLWDTNASDFMQSCGIYVVTRNEEDLFELTIYNDRLVEMYDKLYSWTEDESFYYWTWGGRKDESLVVNFRDSRSYFTHEYLDTTYLDAEFSVGILPMPKFDTNQAEYAHVNWGNNIMLPSTVKNTEMVGQVLELMGYYSRTLVQERYYDDVLQLRVSEAPDDRDMVELIYNTVVFDPGIAFCDGNTQLWWLVYLPCFTIQERAKSVSAYYKANARGAQKWLDKAFTKVK